MSASARQGRGLLAAALVAAAVILPACAGPGGPIDSPAPPVEPGPAPVYAAVGASETVGIGADVPLREAWPRVLHREAMPRETVFVNFGIPGATVADALSRTVDSAVATEPDIVTVWLNANDIIAGVDADDYERDLEQLLGRLRRGGRTRVLVANTPPLDRLPAYLACRPGAPEAAPPCAVPGGLPGPQAVNDIVDRYNSAVAAAAERTGSLVVDLHRVGIEARDAGTAGALVSADGFHPNAAGYEVVARAFAEVLARGGPVRAGGS